jgi:hypothetical protein
MASPAFDENAFDVAAFDVAAFDVQLTVGPTPDVGSGFDRRRMGMYVKRGGSWTLRRQGS